jgi:endonuclease-3
MFMFCSYTPEMQFSFELEGDPLLAKVRRRLLVAFGPQADDQRLDPISQLVCAMVGQETHDEVAAPAVARLLNYFRSWEKLSHGRRYEIENLIRPVTHWENKARDIPRALRMIAARSGALDLEFLTDWEEEAALQWLKTLPGVGPKTASAVLNFSTLRRRTLTVDRHLMRVGIRLGLAIREDDYQSGYDIYMRHVPDIWDAQALYEFHWLVKYLSQTTCTFSKPACARCCLNDLCPGSVSQQMRA